MLELPTDSGPWDHKGASPKAYVTLEVQASVTLVLTNTIATPIKRQPYLSQACQIIAQECRFTEDTGLKRTPERSSPVVTHMSSILDTPVRSDVPFSS